MIQIITIILLIVLSAVANAICDVLTLHYRDSSFLRWFPSYKQQEWWNPEKSMSNMYKDYDPAQGERFTGSTTIFMWLTSGWHCFQFLSVTFWELAMCFAITWSPWAFAVLLGLKLGRSIIHLLSIKLFTNG